MDLLKKIPIQYVGELHQVRLINFSVEREEVLDLLPTGLEVRNFCGRALISMVNVKLRNMRPSFMPKAIHFNYQHIGFRMLLNDAPYTGGEPKGIFFLRSFTDNPLIIRGGGLFTNYNLEQANLQEQDSEFVLRQGEQFLRYKLQEGKPSGANEELYQMVGAVDRAYSYIGDELVRTQIMRERWPIEWVNCSGFETNFFRTARFEGAFQVTEKIDYNWLPPEPVALCA